MPWTSHHHPAGFAGLEPRIRDKAIEIGNAIIAAGYDERAAVPVSIEYARKWAEAHAEVADLSDARDRAQQPAPRVVAAG